ncbi:MAG: bifunctional phosphopantothenoylcysteine decarboxylase/phosphopantothenate--cysteine ligase CoaBC [Luteibaculum sp.]
MWGKNILLGITGGIAAYKIPLLVRLFKQNNNEVRVLVTREALQFVTAETLSVLSENEVLVDFYSENGIWNNHVELGLWADLMVIAPLTANSMSKMAHGQCDNLLLASYLSLKAPCIAFPAMDLDMWKHPSTQENIIKLRKNGVEVVEPASGALASGLQGQGRMPEPTEIFAECSKLLDLNNSYLGKKVLITAGPTFEKIDPVRFIGNHSSGKMGYALAEHFASCGAQVFLISGPTNLDCKHPNIVRIPVFGAEEMLSQCQKHFDDSELAIFCAAVSDFRVEQIAEQKIKREKQASMQLNLVANPDIAASLSARKKHQICIGFALETENGVENAKAKLQRKNLDVIVLNTLNPKEGVDFGSDQSKVTIIDKHNNIFESPLLDKTEIAKHIENQITSSFFKA